MAYPAVSVKDGAVFDSLGANTSERVDLPDGFYIKGGTKGEYLSLVGKEISQSIRGIFSLGQGMSISTLDGQPFDLGAIPTIDYARYRVFSRDYEYYYVIEPGENMDYAGIISKWWERFPFESPWKMKKGKTSLNPDRLKWIKAFDSHIVEAIVMQQTQISMRRPSSFNELLSKKLHRQLSFIKAKLNLQLSPIGGRVTKILPFWDRGVAICHVWFIVNESDPTRGMGCQVYKDGNFFFGPWCERISQDSADAGESQLYNFPPKYTLRSWICGPLYATSVQYNGSSQGMPAPFQPTGVHIYAPGTKYSRDSDIPGMESAEVMATRLAKMAVDEQRKIEQNRLLAIGKVLKDAPIVITQGPPIFKLPTRGIRIVTGIREIYLRSDGGAKWHYAIKFDINAVCEINGNYIDADGIKNRMAPHILIMEFSDNMWGFADKSDRYYAYFFHYQVPQKGCRCESCDNVRKVVALTIEKAEKINEPIPF